MQFRATSYYLNRGVINRNRTSESSGTFDLIMRRIQGRFVGFRAIQLQKVNVRHNDIGLFVFMIADMKLLLTITSGTLSGQVFDLESGFMTVGRGETCTVRFDPMGERIASKQHAFIEARPDGYYIADNNSTNGTIVNGERVQRSKLASGDTVEFGKNGVTATIEIQDGQVFQHPIPQDSFRQLQLDQFQKAASTAGAFKFDREYRVRGLPTRQRLLPGKITSSLRIMRFVILLIAFLTVVVFALFTVVLAPTQLD
jgi:hypothetical protein